MYRYMNTTGQRFSRTGRSTMVVQLESKAFRSIMRPGTPGSGPQRRWRTPATNGDAMREAQTTSRLPTRQTELKGNYT